MMLRYQPWYYENQLTDRNKIVNDIARRKKNLPVVKCVLILSVFYINRQKNHEIEIKIQTVSI